MRAGYKFDQSLTCHWQYVWNSEAYIVQCRGNHFFFAVRLQLDHHHTTVKHTQPTTSRRHMRDVMSAHERDRSQVDSLMLINYYSTTAVGSYSHYGGTRTRVVDKQGSRPVFLFRPLEVTGNGQHFQQQEARQEESGQFFCEESAKPCPIFF